MMPKFDFSVILTLPSIIDDEYELLCELWTYDNR